MVLLFVACARDCERDPPAPGETTLCEVPGWADRNVLVHPPASATGPVPLVLDFHGGGGSKDGADRLSCAEGDADSAHCLTALADREGFAVAFPDGTPKFLGWIRSWNAGGGQDGWRCVGGAACDEGVDDVAYVDDLLDMLGSAVEVDPGRVYATGMSNGAAMAHRLACERPERFAAIVAVGGANQAEGWPGCAPEAPIAVAQIHGTEDPCWMPDGTIGPCLDEDGEATDRFVSVDASMAGWSDRLGCTGQHEGDVVVDPVDDRFSARTTVYEGCAAPLELTWIDGGGHTWPGGWQYLDSDQIGETAPGLVGSELVWAFLSRAGG